MPPSQRTGIVKAQRLTRQVLEEVEALRQACKQHEEGLDLPLHLEPARPVPGNETSQFLYYEDGSLVGFVSLPPEYGIELLGMVHPDHRRRGIGRALLEAARAECRLRGVPDFLLVCEQAAPSGVAFAQAVGAVYRFSEYRMELDTTAISPPAVGPVEILLEPAEAKDLETLSGIQAASFGTPLDAARLRLTRWLQSPDQQFYIGRLDGEPVGSVRVFKIEEESTVYLHTFGVRPEYRGRGYGRQILEKLIALLLRVGWQRLRIEVDTENSNALGLYRSCGFREIATYRYYEMSV